MNKTAHTRSGGIVDVTIPVRCSEVAPTGSGCEGRAEYWYVGSGGLRAACHRHSCGIILAPHLLQVRTWLTRSEVEAWIIMNS